MLEETSSPQRRTNTVSRNLLVSSLSVPLMPVHLLLLLLSLNKQQNNAASGVCELEMMNSPLFSGCGSQAHAKRCQMLCLRL